MSYDRSGSELCPQAMSEQFWCCIEVDGKRLKAGVRPRDVELHPSGRFANSVSDTGMWSRVSIEVQVEVRYTG